MTGTTHISKALNTLAKKSATYDWASPPHGHAWEISETSIGNALKNFQDEVKKTDKTIKDSKLWDILDNIVTSHPDGEKLLDEELKHNKEWQNFKEGNYTNLENWITDLRTLETWAKKLSEKI